MTEERRNFKEYMQDFFNKHIGIVKKNIVNFKEEAGFEDMDKKLLAVFVSKIAISGFMMAAVVGAFMFLIYHALSIILYFHSILSQHRALYILVMGLLVIGVLALILESFKKKPPMRTEREQDSMKKTLQADLLGVIQGLSSMYGLKRPEREVDIATFNIVPCEDYQGVELYSFTVDKDRNTTKPFDPVDFRDSAIRQLVRMEREGLITTPNPYGYITENGSECSILIFSVEDCGSFISMRVARANDESYAAYKKFIASNDKSVTAQDPDF